MNSRFLLPLDVYKRVFRKTVGFQGNTGRNTPAFTMHARFSLFTTALVGAVAANPIAPRQTSDYVGYLISTFSDDVPEVQFHLSDGTSATSFSFLNGGSPVLASTVGTKAVRDIFLATDTARSKYYLLATGMSGTCVQ